MGHGSMRAALAYHAVVGWIDIVLTIAAWPPGTSAARLDPDYRGQDHCGPAAVLPVAGAELRHPPLT
jgi:hypothetical protein